MTIVGLGPHGERASPPERVTLLPQDIETARTKKLRVAIVMHTVTSDWAKHLVQGIVGLLGECGAIVIEVVDCAFSSDVQIAALNRLCEEAPDAIISLPVDNTATRGRGYTNKCPLPTAAMTANWRDESNVPDRTTTSPTITSSPARRM